MFNAIFSTLSTARFSGWWNPPPGLSRVKEGLNSKGFNSSFTMISPSDRWRRRSSPPAQADRVMKTSPLACYVIIVPSAWAGGKERLRHLSNAQTTVKDKINRYNNCPSPLSRFSYMLFLWFQQWNTSMLLYLRSEGKCSTIPRYSTVPVPFWWFLVGRLVNQILVEGAGTEELL